MTLLLWKTKSLILFAGQVITFSAVFSFSVESRHSKSSAAELKVGHLQSHVLDPETDSSCQRPTETNVERQVTQGPTIGRRA